MRDAFSAARRGRRRGSSWLVASVVCLAFAFVAPAHAEDADDAEPVAYTETVNAALAEWNAGNFEEAHALFTKAHKLLASARTLRGLGMAEFELRRYLDSITHLEQALISSVKPLDAPLRKQTQQLLERALQYVAKLNVELTPPVSAELLVDGLLTPPEPDGSLRLQIGEHVLEARADGYRVAQQRVTVQGGKQQTIHLTLQPEAATAAGSVAIVPASKAPTTSDEKRSVWKSPWLWTGVALVVAGVVTAVVIAANAGGPETVTADPVRTPNSPAGVVVLALH